MRCGSACTGSCAFLIGIQVYVLAVRAVDQYGRDDGNSRQLSLKAGLDNQCIDDSGAAESCEAGAIAR